MKILMLHGYGQSGTIFEAETAPLRKAILSRYPSTEFDFLTGPHRADSLLDGNSDNVASSQSDPDSAKPAPSNAPFTRAGWLPSAIKRGCTELTPDQRAGIIDTLRFLSTALNSTTEPYDGIICFSQGASVGVAIASLLEKHHAPPAASSSDLIDIDALVVKSAFTTHHPPLKFVVSISGFVAPPCFPGLEYIYSEKVKTPVLHVLGKIDDHLREEEMLALIRMCEGSAGETSGFDGESDRVIWWDGGHYVPGKRSVMEKVVKFIASCI
ncbi:serine hydrolase FSH [Kalaharituber pfeilii]|nr:serine hydrolase FSH [Kalaharituber pfeilii]